MRFNTRHPLLPDWEPDVKAPRNEHGYVCPVCGREGLSDSEMEAVWSPADWAYVATHCRDCRSKTDEEK